ncbi:MAG: hypothetical protein PHU03_06825 [Syntrophales bacterium]|nr:hypothetical protein [Syntrophales bacterium]
MSVTALSGSRDNLPVLYRTTATGLQLRNAGVSHTSALRAPDLALSPGKPLAFQVHYGCSTMPQRKDSGMSFYSASGYYREIIPAEFYSRGVIVNTWA